MAATSPSTRSPASNSIHSPRTPLSSNTHHIPTSSSAVSVTALTSSQHSYFPPQLPINLNINRRPGSSAQGSHPVSRSSSATSSLTAASQSSQNPPSPQFHNNDHNHHRDKQTTATGVTHPQKPNQFIMLQERRPEPFPLTSSLAPPSVIPMTAAGISSAKNTSRKSLATSLKLPMLPSTMAPVIPTSNSGNANPAYTFSNHPQAYAHSLSAQQQLQLHQKEIIHQATRATGIPQHLLSTGPMSPRLIPLGSPGPVTPLTLEDNPDGFFAGSHGFGHQQLGQQLSIVASGQRGGL